MEIHLRDLCAPRVIRIGGGAVRWFGSRKMLRSPMVTRTSTKSSGFLKRKRERNPGRKLDKTVALKAGFSVKCLSSIQDDVRALKSS